MKTQWENVGMAKWRVDDNRMGANGVDYFPEVFEKENVEALKGVLLFFFFFSLSLGCG